MRTLASSSPSLPLFQQADQWFRRASASLLGTLPCSKGCSACCIGVFPITRLDVPELHRGLDRLPAVQQEAIEARAHAQVKALESAYPVLKSNLSLDCWDDRIIDKVVEEFSTLPCPALSPEGTCHVYACRPVTCRTMGIPNEVGGLVHGACSVQTAVPIVRLSPFFRAEENQLAEQEMVELAILNRDRPDNGDEIWLPYGFLRDLDATP
jgi:Fe-S-cluster containining protein